MFQCLASAEVECAAQRWYLSVCKLRLVWQPFQVEGKHVHFCSPFVVANDIGSSVQFFYNALHPAVLVLLIQTLQNRPDQICPSSRLRGVPDLTLPHQHLS